MREKEFTEGKYKYAWLYIDAHESPASERVIRSCLLMAKS